MRFSKLKAAGLAAGVSVFAFLSGPASAGSTTFTDPTGVDYDAACLVGLGGAGAPCAGLSLYDGSTKGTDLTGVTLSSNASGQFVATFNVVGGIPAGGSTNLAAFDGPSNSFVGGSYYAMFQNKNVQTNVPTNGVPRFGGCARLPTGQVFDQHGSWKDGYHFFVGFGVGWDGAKWIQSVQIGEYDPSPDGAFFFNEVGTNDGTWHDTDPTWMNKGTNWDVTVTTSPTGPSTITVTIDGVLKSSNTNCATGTPFKTVFGQPGDTIANVKGYSTADLTATSPVTIPGSLTCDLTGGILCIGDVTSVGGFILGSDTTAGNSTAGLLGQNTPGIAFTRGIIDHHTGLLDITDTLGDGPTCPTPTVGGTLPSNPLFTPDTACQFDDDQIARGTLLAEFWETANGFTF